MTTGRYYRPERRVLLTLRTNPDVVVGIAVVLAFIALAVFAAKGWIS